MRIRAMVAAVGACGPLIGLAQAATGLPFVSSFESGTFSEWNGGADATLTVTDADASSGTRSAQGTMALGQSVDNYKDYVFGDHPGVRGTALSASTGLTLTFDSKFDSGFNCGTSNHLFKIAIINFEDENSRRRYQVVLDILAGSKEYFVEHLKWNADRSFNRSFPAFTQNVGQPVAARLGQWDRLRLFIKPNTIGRSDGIVRFWVNDVLKAEYTGVALREDTPYNPNKLILSNRSVDGLCSGVQRWDNFRLVESSEQVMPAMPGSFTVR